MLYLAAIVVGRIEWCGCCLTVVGVSVGRVEVVAVVIVGWVVVVMWQGMMVTVTGDGDGDRW